MSVGPPEDYFEDRVGPDDAAWPTRPSERGAWRHHAHAEHEEETEEELDDWVGVSPPRRI